MTEADSRDTSPRRVSVCTVTYERHALLGVLEQCLIQQDYPLRNVEWVILDDSPHKPEGINFDLAKQAGAEVIYVPIEKKLKLGAKRNLSHEHCRGEFIIYMDDDDYYPPSRLSHAIESLEASDSQIAGCSELPLLLLPECSTWMTHSFGANHATGNTLAFHRSFLENHRYDPDATEAEESQFLDGFCAPMVQLDPRKTITCIGHSRNTVDKRRFITANQGSGISRIHAAAGDFAPSEYLQNYRQALAEIEEASMQGVSLAASPTHQDVSSTAGLKAAELPRIAVITPYYQESLDILKRCHDSVINQTLAATHFLIADGPGLDAVDALQCRHIRLGGTGHSDNGNTPRAVGSLCAMNEGFTCIAYLDADNWFLPDHLESAISTQQQHGCDVVFTGREICFPDGELLPELDEEDLSHSHADTSCFVIFEPAFKALAIWAQMPRELGPFCDRVAFNYLTSHFDCAWTDRPSVFFETWYWGHFGTAGKLAPTNAKFLTARPASEWKRVGQQFRKRSHTPFMPASLPESPDKVRVNLISILGPLGCGAHRIQRDLCLHITFFGIPPNNFLSRWQNIWGNDYETRYDSSLILEQLSALGDHVEAVANWPSASVIDLTETIPARGTFNALEAYFRLVQKSMPNRGREFSRLWGVANVIERSCSASFAAKLLFEMLPMHRALLVIGDPIAQIEQMLRYNAAHLLEASSDSDLLPQLCAQYFDALIHPLESAPSEQLLIIHQGSYLSAPQQSLRTIATWFDIHTEEWPSGALRRTDTHGTYNRIYQNELEELEKLIDLEIHPAESTSDRKGITYGDIDHALELGMENGEGTGLTGEDIRFLRSLFKPLSDLMATTTSAPDSAMSPEALGEQFEAHNTAGTEKELQLNTCAQKLAGLLRKRLEESTMDHVWPGRDRGSTTEHP